MKSSDQMESINPALHLSQSNLQDFIECPRRFQLKVIDNISWPAAYLEPLSQLEQATVIGNKFHQLCQQFFTGIDPNFLSNRISDPNLKIMWESFLPIAKNIQTENLFAEIILSSPFLGHQLVAKYDLVLMTSDDRFIIYDWKTSNKKPARTLLSQRFQTNLYPLIFVRSGYHIFKINHPSPESISMIYWYPMSSDPEEIFPYSKKLYLENINHLTKVIGEIDDLIDSADTFPLTTDKNQCRKCVYRSLCERGNQAGDFDIFSEIDQEDLSNVHFELDNINEVEF